MDRSTATCSVSSASGMGACYSAWLSGRSQCVRPPEGRPGPGRGARLCHLSAIPSLRRGGAGSGLSGDSACGVPSPPSCPRALGCPLSTPCTWPRVTCAGGGRTPPGQGCCSALPAGEAAIREPPLSCPARPLCEAPGRWAWLLGEGTGCQVTPRRPRPGHLPRCIVSWGPVCLSFRAHASVSGDVKAASAFDAQ